MPMDIQHASKEFDAFLADARDRSGLATRNQTYTMTQGVLQAFRRRLSVTDAIRFAGALPPVLRAIFVAEWNPEEPLAPFGDRESMIRDVQALRRDHNFSPATCIDDVAAALRAHIDERAFDRVLAALPAGAAEFWRV
ncbi:MAG: DUF2267 domain-containing protein [Methylocystis sp.]